MANQLTKKISNSDSAIKFFYFLDSVSLNTGNLKF